MTPPAEMSGQHETARQHSRAAWGAVASGWYAQREELWRASRPVGEWMVRRLDPQPGDTVLELAAGLADTGLMVAEGREAALLREAPAHPLAPARRKALLQRYARVAAGRLAALSDPESHAELRAALKVE